MMIKHLWTKAIKWIDPWSFFFPPKCLYCLVGTEKKSIFCAGCQKELETTPQKGFKFDFEDVSPGLLNTKVINRINFSLIDYSPRGQLLVKAFKYDGFYNILDSIFSKDFQKKYTDELNFHFCENDILVPIPLHISKMRERGFNQALVFAEFLQKKNGGEIWEVLKRVKNNKAQARQGLSQRQKNSEELFKIKIDKRNNYSKQSVWIVDDVFTTGSTARSAIKVLEKSGLKVKGVLTLARSGYSISVEEDWMQSIA
jgi:competence protein ComFC